MRGRLLLPGWNIGVAGVRDFPLGVGPRRGVGHGDVRLRGERLGVRLNLERREHVHSGAQFERFEQRLVEVGLQRLLRCGVGDREHDGGTEHGFGNDTFEPSLVPCGQ